MHYIDTKDYKQFEELKSGDIVYLSGVVYTARDAAHKLIVQCINEKKELPFLIQNSILYYTGPTPTPPSSVIGSAGPTSSYRMDSYTPLLLDMGLKAMIGKGDRGQNVIDSIKKNKAIYFSTIGGAGAYLSKRIKKSEVIAYPYLLSEAIRRLEVENFPLFVSIDSEGNCLNGNGC